MFYPALWMTPAAVLFGLGSLTMPLAAIATPWQPSAIAQASPRFGKPPREGWLRELNLSRDQIQKIREIRDRYKERLTQQRQAARQAQKELRELVSGNASPEQIRQKHDQAQSLQQELASTRIESMLAIREVLTVEQRQKLSEVMRQRGQTVGDRMMEGF
jgi:periplasmic protein CpxP/Spy